MPLAKDNDTSPKRDPRSVFDPELIARNSAHVAAMPRWMKGSPVNERKPPTDPMTPQRLREIADDYERRAKLHSRRDLQEKFRKIAAELRAHADWLEQYEKDLAAAKAQPAVLVPREQLERNSEWQPISTDGPGGEMTLEELIQLEPRLRAANSWIQRELAEPVRQDSMPTASPVAIATLLDAAPAYFEVVKAAREWRDADRDFMQGDLTDPQKLAVMHEKEEALRSALARLEEGGS